MDIMEQALRAINGQNTNENATMFAPTKGLGFHQFDGNTPIADVLQQIGANFTVRKDKLVRLPQDILEAALRGETVNIKPEHIIHTHCATVREEDDKTISVVGNDYGVIQNTQGFEVMDLVTNSSVTGVPMSVVSAGLVHDFEPYVQVKMGDGARLDGDNSDTEFYCFFHNSHDGGSAMKLTFSTIRVICANTFMMNMRSEGLTFKHSKNVEKRIDLKDPEVQKQIIAKVQELHLMKDSYIARMNSFRLAKVTDSDIDEYITNLFLDTEKMKSVAREHNYKWEEINTDDISQRMKNMIYSFKDTLESGIGQNTNRGTKKWLFDGTTNYLSNTLNYGSTKDTEFTRATKRFDGLMDGKSNKRMERAYALLAA